MKAKVIWDKGMAFEAQLDGFKFHLDADESVGGEKRGPRPKGFTLVSLAGCTAMDVISILQKMRVKVDSFEVTTDSVLAEDHPKKFLAITIKYLFAGEKLPLEKLKKAISLSEDRYCGVSASLKPAVKISSELVVNGQKIEK